MLSYTMSKEVALNPRNSQLQNIKTLIHELAHAKLHTATTINQYTKTEKEFEAEMVAYCVSSYFCLDTSDYSLQYLNTYTKNTDIREKKKLLSEIKETSKEFIEIIENTLSNDLEIENTNDKTNDDLSNNDLSNDDDEVSVADKIDTSIYTKFVWSESKDIEDGSVYKFEVSNEIIETLSKIHKAKSLKGYDKTKFELYFDSNCTDKFFTGRIDIGDRYADNLKEHIYKSVKEIHRDSNISTNHMKALFDVLDIKLGNPPKSNTKNNDISLNI